MVTARQPGPAPAALARRIDHVGVVVRDVEAAAAAFDDRFGLRVTRRWVDPAGRFELAYPDAGDTTTGGTS